MILIKNLTKIYRTPIRGKNFIVDLFNRQYKKTTALNNVSFKIGENELVGFIGPNGAGKTTTLKILSGILFPTSGQVKVLNYNPFDKNPIFLKQIGFVMGQRNQLIWDLPAVDTFVLNKAIYEISDRDYQRNIDDLAALLNCRDVIDKPVKTLSLGQRMKMELIASLLHRPKLVFFDEPTIGLDIFSQEAVREFIRTYQKEFKSTIILTSHYLEDVKRLTKRLIIINQGKILYDDSLNTILKKYGDEKYVTVTLEESIDKTILTKVGRIITNQFPKVVYRVKRIDIPTTINLITQHLPYSDLTVEDERIEEIIKKLFGKLK